MPELLLLNLMRFWIKVDRKTENECWNWLGSTSHGYGSFGVNGKLYKAHRISYFIHYNKDPGESLICHKCNNTSCVNPYHLFLGNQSENVKQCYEEGRNPRKGILQPSSKLSENAVKEIKRMKGKIKCVEVSEIFCVSTSTIYQIWSGHIWSHIQ